MAMRSSVSLKGKVVKQSGDNMYIISVPRTSGTKDLINIYTERKLQSDDNVSLCGEMRTKGSTLYVKENAGKIDGSNIATVTGTIGKYPVLRVMAKNYALDLSVRTKTSDGSEVYIPVVCLGKCAKAIQGITIGCTVKVAGRIQSRVFTSTKTNTSRIWHELVAFSVSILETEDNVKKFT